MTKKERNQLEEKEERSNAKDFLVGSIVGAVVGAATALLLAPKSGKELRKDLNEQASLLKEKTETLKDTAITKGSDLAAAAKEKTNTLTKAVSEQSSQLLNKVKSIKKSESSETTDEATGADSDIKTKLKETQKAFEETEANL
ncbi:YtxH domain-containing protein [Bacillus aquiflavi]|uniref:YtxH domain-containing protein n=1 Tax=Bacillus aquiflavi TaxID=2672567 RepID=A0A6B3VVB2_9BACI|nr:YtxH domain-containing protein [Bacillus aquiflavi]MBA4537702.1 YtxH domain-containing protein [Bacillus aquiflavi]NEY81959.1 YtxH domain-containing protein [Bacillus aquiflavi]UAC47582.1 YtxH domain-containing protein [Bacillus aquiflavi]